MLDINAAWTLRKTLLPDAAYTIISTKLSLLRNPRMKGYSKQRTRGLIISYLWNVSFCGFTISMMPHHCHNRHIYSYSYRERRCGWTVAVLGSAIIALELCAYHIFHQLMGTVPGLNSNPCHWNNPLTASSKMPHTPVKTVYLHALWETSQESPDWDLKVQKQLLPHSCLLLIIPVHLHIEYVCIK